MIRIATAATVLSVVFASAILVGCPLMAQALSGHVPDNLLAYSAMRACSRLAVCTQKIVVVVPDSHNPPYEEVAVSGIAGGINWSLDHRQLAYSDGTDIYLHDLLTRVTFNLSRSLALHSFDNAPAWSPDGAQIAYLSYEENNIALHITRLSPFSVRTIPVLQHVARSSDWLAWSRSDFLLLERPQLVLGYPRADDVYRFEIAAESFKAVTSAEDEDYNPVISPQGDKIAFLSGSGGITELYVMNADGSAVQALTDTHFVKGRPFWLDNQSILYGERVNSRFTLEILHLSSLDRVAVSSILPVYAYTVSPDGAQIAYLGSQDGTTFQLCILAEQRRQQQCFASSAYSDSILAWS
ncbi:MAG: hypothetical protein ABI700_09930 [Chloroflexota bacterium]